MLVLVLSQVMAFLTSPEAAAKRFRAPVCTALTESVQD